MAVDQSTQSESARLTASNPLVVSDEDLRSGLDIIDACLADA